MGSLSDVHAPVSATADGETVALELRQFLRILAVPADLTQRWQRLATGRGNVQRQRERPISPLRSPTTTWKIHSACTDLP